MGILDLKFVSNILRFYQKVKENASNVIKELCNDENEIHDALVFDDDEQGDEIAVTFKSPEAVLHQQINNVMEFINTFDDKRRLRCSLAALCNELKQRAVIGSEEQFENLKALIDR